MFYLEKRAHGRVIHTPLEAENQTIRPVSPLDRSVSPLDQSAADWSNGLVFGFYINPAESAQYLLESVEEVLVVYGDCVERLAVVLRQPQLPQYLAQQPKWRHTEERKRESGK